VEDIAIFYKWNKIQNVGIFVDLYGTDKIYKYLLASKESKIELFEICELIFQGSSNYEKYRKIKHSGLQNYTMIILSGSLNKACILCKEKNINKVKYVIMIKLYMGLPENVINLMIKDIDNKGGYDYELRK